MSEVEKMIHAVKGAELDNIDVCMDAILVVMHLLKESEVGSYVSPSAISSVLSLVYGAIGDTVDSIRRAAV